MTKLPPTCESVMSRKLPPLMFGADTSSTYPSQNMPPLISVLKLFRQLIMGDVLVTMTPILSTTLSLIPSWSGTKTSLGALSGITVEVTHMTPSPGSGLVAVQPVGSAGAVTLSQFSTHGPEPGVVAVGVGDTPPGVEVAVAVGPGVPLGPGDGPGPPLPRLYTSTKPTPVPLFFPASSAVY